MSSRKPAVEKPLPVVENKIVTEDLSHEFEVSSVSNETFQQPTKTPSVSITERKLKIPVEINDHVEKWITYFTQKDRERFQRFLNRGQRYRDVVESVLEENDLPAELYYLAMIESGFRTDAHSHASAVGVWQFIPGTARRYGLRIDHDVDERKDPIRATEAAAKYLRDLYNVFGSWHLAMAAYNSGEIRVLRAIFKGRTRNFWELIQAKTLPSETANYIPKFLAVVLIGQDPKKYGFTDVNLAPSYPRLEAIEVPGGLHLGKLSQAANLSVETIKKVNPHLKYLKTPSHVPSYEIWIPADQAAQLKSQQKTLFVKYAKPKRVIATRAEPTSTSSHRVRAGETLLGIAHKYKLSLGHLKRINDLKSDRIKVGMHLRTQSKTYKPSRFVKYKVKRGENLTVIAKKFKTSIKHLRKINRISKSQIVVGQILKITVSEM